MKRGLNTNKMEAAIDRTKVGFSGENYEASVIKWGKYMIAISKYVEAIYLVIMCP